MRVQVSSPGRIRQMGWTPAPLSVLWSSKISIQLRAGPTCMDFSTALMAVTHSPCVASFGLQSFRTCNE